MHDGDRSVANHLEKVSAYGIEAVVLGKMGVFIERSKQCEAPGRAVHHGCRDGVIESYHRIVRYAHEKLIEPQDLLPVGILCAGGLIVKRRDRGLQLIGADGAPGQRSFEQCRAFGDVRLIP